MEVKAVLVLFGHIFQICDKFSHLFELFFFLSDHPVGKWVEIETNYVLTYDSLSKKGGQVFVFARTCVAAASFLAAAATNSDSSRKTK